MWPFRQKLREDEIARQRKIVEESSQRVSELVKQIQEAVKEKDDGLAR